MIAQTGKQLVPRAADNFYYFAEMCTRVDGHTYPTPHAPQLHAVPPGRRVRADQPVERAVHDGHLEDRAVPRLRQHGGAEDERAVADDGRAPGRAGARGRACPRACSTSCTAPARGAGEPLCAHPDVRAISFTGSTATGNRIVQAAGLKKFSMELGGKSPFVVFDDADLSRALDAALFMIFSNNGERCTAGSRILVQKSIYADFAARVRRARQAHHGRRSARREDHRRPDDQPAAPGQGAPLHRAGPERRRHAAVRRARRAARCRRTCARATS